MFLQNTLLTLLYFFKMTFIFLYVFIWIVQSALAIKPVFLLHGVLTGNSSMKDIEDRIKQVNYYIQQVYLVTGY